MATAEYVTPEALRRKLLRALRDEPLDPYQLAADVGQPEHRVRGELKWLRRRRLVLEQFGATRMTWRLTPLGEEAAWSEDQVELDV